LSVSLFVCPPLPIDGKNAEQGTLLPQPQRPKPFSQLAIYFAEFNPDDELEEEPQDELSPHLALPDTDLRLRSAPWDDILTHSDISSLDSSSHHADEDSDQSELELDSWQRNLLPRSRNPPTHYRPTQVPALPATSALTQLQDPWISSAITHGVDLPPPQHAPRIFQRTPPSVLMDQVIQDFQQQGIIQPHPVVAAYRAFLVPKSDGAARFVMDLSPLTPYYRVPHITLYSAARILFTLQPWNRLFKIDLTSGFYQIQIREQHWRHYGIFYRGQKFAFTRLPMGHPLTPYILQRISLAVAKFLNQHYDISMNSYLDDWLLFSPQPPAARICRTIEQLGFTINYAKSVIVPTHRLIYLGLQIDTTTQQLQPTPACIQHMHQLLDLVPDASPLDLRRIAGYVSWLAWLMNWPKFMATHILHRETFWLRWADRHRLLSIPRTMGTQRRSILLYVDATPTSIGVYVASRPPQRIHQAFTDQLPIAAAELAAALFALIWVGSRLRQPTAITIATDSTVVYYVLSTGKGYTMRHNQWLQSLYIRWFSIKIHRGHGLVMRWVPSQANLADPVSRGILP
jgi:ribonuclease HI